MPRRRQRSTNPARRCANWSRSPARCAPRLRPEPPGEPMNIHEYQAKQLLAKFGVPVLPGAVAYTAAEAADAATRLGGAVWVVKAQIHAGGRGKAGGVKLVRSPEEAADAAKQMLGKPLV